MRSWCWELEHSFPLLCLSSKNSKNENFSQAWFIRLLCSLNVAIVDDETRILCIHFFSVNALCYASKKECGTIELVLETEECCFKWKHWTSSRTTWEVVVNFFAGELLMQCGRHFGIAFWVSSRLRRSKFIQDTAERPILYQNLRWLFSMTTD